MSSSAAAEDELELPHWFQMTYNLHHDLPRFVYDWYRRTSSHADTAEGRYGTTVVSENNGTFICELIMERYINLRNTQKTFKNHKLWSKQKFLRILSSLHWCLLETSRFIIIEVSRFCIYIF